LSDSEYGPPSGSMRIKCAAILHNGVIYEGERHCEIGFAMLRDGVCERPYPGGDAQGFVTECGKFVRRAPALMIAIRAGQVTAGKTCHPHHLFSEDLHTSNSAICVKKGGEGCL